MSISRHAASTTRSPLPQPIPFNARGTKAVELTFRETLRLGHNYIGTEHLLLALLELENGSGILSGLGLTKDATEQAIGTRLAKAFDTPGRAGEQ